MEVQKHNLACFLFLFFSAVNLWKEKCPRDFVQTLRELTTTSIIHVKSLFQVIDWLFGRRSYWYITRFKIIDFEKVKIRFLNGSSSVVWKKNCRDIFYKKKKTFEVQLWPKIGKKKNAVLFLLYFWMDIVYFFFVFSSDIPLTCSIIWWSFGKIPLKVYYVKQKIWRYYFLCANYNKNPRIHEIITCLFCFALFSSFFLFSALRLHFWKIKSNWENFFFA